MAGGFAPHTLPRVWMSQLVGPLLDRTIPMVRATRLERRTRAGALAFLFPIILVAYVLALPVEWFRGWRVAKHNQRIRRELDDGSAALNVSSGYREPALVPAGWLADLVGADRVLIVHFRTERERRIAFCGTAVVALLGADHTLACVLVYRNPPRAHPDVMKTVATATTAPVEHHHWEWEFSDPYGLTVRDERPW